MFKHGDIVKNKWDDETAKVARMHTTNPELMFVYPKQRFIKGGFSHTGYTALINNYEIVEHANYPGPQKKG